MTFRVLPRFGRGDRVRWFKGPNQFTSHKMNAWNEGSKIFFDTCVSPGNLFPWFPEWGKPYDPSKAAVKLTFFRGASLPDPNGLFNASLEAGTRRAIDIHEGKRLAAPAFKALIRAAVE